jgi:hypothetical protein
VGCLNLKLLQVISSTTSCCLLKYLVFFPEVLLHFFRLFPQLLRVVSWSTWYFSLNYFCISSGDFLNYFVLSPEVYGIFPVLLPVVYSTTWGLFANYFPTYLANFPELLPAASWSSYPNNVPHAFPHYILVRMLQLWHISISVNTTDYKRCLLNARIEGLNKGKVLKQCHSWLDVQNKMRQLSYQSPKVIYS